jgi:hypothetical protein
MRELAHKRAYFTGLFIANELLDSGIAPDLTVAANVFLGWEILKKGLLGRLGFLAERDTRERVGQEPERVGVVVPETSRLATFGRTITGGRGRSGDRLR